ncbi:MAG: hypothetical protein ACRC4X_05435 [Cetobacterium sp.]
MFYNDASLVTASTIVSEILTDNSTTGIDLEINLSSETILKMTALITKAGATINVGAISICSVSFGNFGINGGGAIEFVTPVYSREIAYTASDFYNEYYCSMFRPVGATSFWDVKNTNGFERNVSHTIAPGHAIRSGGVNGTTYLYLDGSTGYNLGDRGGGAIDTQYFSECWIRRSNVSRLMRIWEYWSAFNGAGPHQQVSLTAAEKIQINNIDIVGNSTSHLSTSVIGLKWTHLMVYYDNNPASPDFKRTRLWINGQKEVDVISSAIRGQNGLIAYLGQDSSGGNTYQGDLSFFRRSGTDRINTMGNFTPAQPPYPGHTPR